MKKISKGTQVFLVSMVLYVGVMVFMLYQVLDSVDPRYRESAEESQVEAAQLLAALVEQDVQGGRIDASRLASLFHSVYARSFSATIYGVEKTRVELRVYVTDAAGVVLYDSTGRDTGADFSNWRDVQLTLAGAYGARTSRDAPDDATSSVMYVGAPVRWQGRVVGMVSVGKPVRSLNRFVQNARGRIMQVGMGASAALLVLVLFIGLWFVRPFRLLREYWHWLYAQPTLRPVAMVRQAVAVLRMASYDMRDAVAGRNYVSDYVQTLTHEFKSPLSGIRGAAELLQEPMDAQQQRHFAENILRDGERIQHTVDRMLELTRLEGRRTLPEKKPVALHSLLHELVSSMQSRAAEKHLYIALNAPTPMTVRGDAYLLERAISNVLDNALAFSPRGTAQQAVAVVVTLHRLRNRAVITVMDNGPGIPDYAQSKVFERFFSLPRPASSGASSNRKSTGLGLALVKEVMELHAGSVRVGNCPPPRGSVPQPVSGVSGAAPDTPIPAATSVEMCTGAYAVLTLTGVIAT